MRHVTAHAFRPDTTDNPRVTGPGCRFSCGLVLLFVSVTTFAHRDRIITMESDGSLPDIPAEYQPAVLKLQTDEVGEFALTQSVSIQFGVFVTHLPQCIVRLFVLPTSEEVRLAASWYHDLSQLPPYLSIKLPKRSYRRPFFDGHTIVVAMDTAGIISIQEHDVEEDGMTSRPLALEKLCSTEEITSLEPQIFDEMMPEAKFSIKVELTGSGTSEQ